MQVDYLDEVSIILLPDDELTFPCMLITVGDGRIELSLCSSDSLRDMGSFATVTAAVGAAASLLFSSPETPTGSAVPH